MDAFILLDKPQGLSSNQALGQVKRLYHEKKAGHAGTLDPMATGLLPIAFGRATKLLEYLLASEKRYTATLKLGVQTNTGDSEGSIINEAPPLQQLPLHKITQILDQFKGEMTQIPPMYSALKHQGHRLYQLARQGKVVDRPTRNIYISQLQCLAYDESQHILTFDTICSKGTYVRTLGEDIAKSLGTVGHLTALRRTETAGFTEKKMVSLATLHNSSDQQKLLYCIPIENVLTDIKRVDITESQWHHLAHGKSISMNFEAQVRLFYKDHLVAIATCHDKKIVSRKLIAIP